MTPEEPPNASCAFARWDVREAMVRSISCIRASRSVFRDVIVDARPEVDAADGEEVEAGPEANCERGGTEELGGEEEA